MLQEAIEKTEPQESSNDERLKLLRVYAEIAFQALLFGVEFTWADFVRCDEIEREAVILAQQRFRVQNALRQGRSARATDDVAEAAIMAEVDGGELHDAMLFSKVMRDYGASDARESSI